MLRRCFIACLVLAAAPAVGLAFDNFFDVLVVSGGRVTKIPHRHYRGFPQDAAFRALMAQAASANPGATIEWCYEGRYKIGDTFTGRR